MTRLPDLMGQGELFILIDGAKVRDLPAHIYNAELSPVCDALYRGTELAPLSEVSPWLVKAKPDDAVAKMCFVDWAHQGAAIALFSDEGFDELIEHLRSLLMASISGGDDFIFRFYDPEILRCLLLIDDKDDAARLMGPCKAIALQNRIDGTWKDFQNTSPKRNRNSAKFQIDEKHQVAMEQAAERTALIKLELHTKAYFPHLLKSGDGSESNSSRISGFVKAAKDKGLLSTRDIALYINTVGWLGEKAFCEPAVQDLWHSDASQPGKAIARIAEYAEKQSKEGQRHE